MNMIISFFRSAVLFLLIFFCLDAKGQDFTPIHEPEIDLNWNLGNRWSMNAGFGTRHLIDEEYDARQVEISQNTSYEVGFYSKVSFGITYRWRNTFNANRQDETLLIGQYAYSKKFNRLKIAHRFQSQVRLRENLTINRNRYRFSVELPLSGRKVDLKEFFLVGSTEALWSIAEKIKPEVGQRFSAELGYKLADNLQAMMGTQVRFDNYNQGVSRSIFFNTGLVISL